MTTTARRRLTASGITDDQLEALYDERDRYRYEAQQWRGTYGEHALRDTLARLGHAEAAASAAYQLADGWAQMRTHGSAAYELREVLKNAAPAAVEAGAGALGRVLAFADRLDADARALAGPDAVHPVAANIRAAFGEQPGPAAEEQLQHVGGDPDFCPACRTTPSGPAFPQCPGPDAEGSGT